MLSGAVIGAIAGAAYVIYLGVKARRRLEILGVLEKDGAAAALTALNKSIAPVSALRASAIMDQQERAACLAILGAADELERELAAHRGPLTAVAQVGAVGYLAVALRRDDPALAIAHLSRLATRFEQEGSALFGLVKKKVRALEGVGAAIVGGAELTPEIVTRARSVATRQLPFTRIIVFEALARAAEKSGGPGELFRREVRMHTRVFDKEQ